MFSPDTKVLIVDDMMTMRKLVGKACKNLGLINLVEAADGQLAWQVLNDPESKIQLVISDWNMPNCSGLELLKRVRKDSRFKSLPFMLLTAESEESQVKEAIMAGVDNYITKPFTAEILGQKLQAVYKKRTAA
jgi:two-component system chemotaxis response regulator CheY